MMRFSRDMIQKSSFLRRSARVVPYIGIGIALALSSTVLATTVGTNISTDGSLTVSGGATTLRGVAYTWPAADGTSGQFISTDGSGALSWTTASPSSGGGWTDDGAAVRLTAAADQVSIGNATPISPSVLSVRATTSAATAGIFRAAATPQVTIFQIQDSAAGNIFSVTATSSLLLSQGLIHVATTTGTSTIVSNLQVGSTLLLGSGGYLTGTRLNFTAASAIGTDSGALTIAPIAGSSVNVNLSTTGDFVVTTDDLVVDTSANRVGIQTATPNTTLEVVGTASTTNLIVGGNGTSLAGVVAGYCTIPATTVTASSTNYANCTGATGVINGDRVFVQATSSLADNFIIQSASSTVTAGTINVKILNTGMITGTGTGINSFNFWAFR